MPPKSYSVIVAPSDGSRSYHLQVSGRLVVAIVAFLTFAGIGFVFMLATYGSLVRKVDSVEDLEARCAALEREAEKVGVLQGEVERLREMDRRVRSLMGLPEPPSVAPGEGEPGAGTAGGEASSDSLELPEASIPDQATWSRLEKDLASRKGKLRWPLEGFISSTFGEGRTEGGVHAGIDIAAPRNAPVTVPLGGKVIDAGWHPIYGNVAVIDHGDGLVTVYGHSARLLVREGARVREGDTLALVGSTGQSSAPHLHFEARKDGYLIDPLFLLKRKERS
jgi:murein DD-endopeptidase MepM/ murein hydrolase activator NlpD